MKPEAEALMLDAENAPYALAYIKLFCEQYNEQTDDGPSATRWSPSPPSISAACWCTQAAFRRGIG